MQQRIWWLGGIVMVVVLLAVLFGRRSEFDGKDPAAAVSDRALPRVRNAGTGQAEPVAISDALPRAGIPLSGIFETLKQRADAGDARAACRLAVELIRCSSAVDTVAGGGLNRMRDGEALFVEMNMHAAADAAAAMQLRQLQTAERCVGVTVAQRQLAGRYLHQAARGGLNEARVRFADGQGFASRASIYGVLHDPMFEQWKRDAPGFAQQALAQGEPAAVMMLMTAYSDDNSLFAGLVPDDLASFHAQRLLLTRLRGARPVVTDGLDPQQEARAQSEATRMHGEYFNNAVFPKDKHFAQALDSRGLLQSDDAPTEPCR